MKPRFLVLAVWLALLPVGLRAADEPTQTTPVAAKFWTEGNEVKGTITMPPGQYVFGGFIMAGWDGYARAFTCVVNPDVTLGRVTIEVRASIAVNGRGVIIAGRGYKLTDPAKGTPDQWKVLGETSQWVRGGMGDDLKPPKNVTLEMVNQPYQPGQLGTVAQWTVTHKNGQPANVIKLDLWVTPRADEVAARVKYRSDYDGAQALRFARMSSK